MCARQARQRVQLPRQSRPGSRPRALRTPRARVPSTSSACASPLGSAGTQSANATRAGSGVTPGARRSDGGGWRCAGAVRCATGPSPSAPTLLAPPAAPAAPGPAAHDTRSGAVQPRRRSAARPIRRGRRPGGAARARAQTHTAARGGALEPCARTHLVRELRDLSRAALLLLHDV